MGKYVIGVIALILLGAIVAYIAFLPSPELSANPEGDAGDIFVASTSTYSSPAYGFSIVYPNSYRVDDGYAYEAFGPEKLIHGVKFEVPLSTATGTNLSSDTGLSIETLPRAKKCTGDIFLMQDVRPETRDEGGVSYSVATSSEGAAGNVYEEAVYAIPESSPCIAVRYFIHSSRIENYPEGALREFNRSALLAEFDEMRRSLVLSAPAPASSTPASAGE